MLKLTDIFILIFLRLVSIRLTHRTKTVVAETEAETEMDNIKTNSKMEEDKI